MQGVLLGFVFSFVGADSFSGAQERLQSAFPASFYPPQALACVRRFCCAGREPAGHCSSAGAGRNVGWNSRLRARLLGCLPFWVLSATSSQRLQVSWSLLCQMGRARQWHNLHFANASCANTSLPGADGYGRGFSLMLHGSA